MFTGIVSDIGTVQTVSPMEAGVRICIATGYNPETIALGASIACSGPCLTVVERGTSSEGAYFAVEASPETLQRTTIGEWRPGRRINLERSLRAGDELGGHLVSGHVDAIAAIAAREDEGETVRFLFDAPESLVRYIAEKGSVSLDGTSLTVNGIDGARFWVTIIPHTLAVTTWGERRAGDRVNLEVDLLARYLDRLRQ